MECPACRAGGVGRQAGAGSISEGEPRAGRDPLRGEEHRPLTPGGPACQQPGEAGQNGEIDLSGDGACESGSLWEVQRWETAIGSSACSKPFTADIKRKDVLVTPSGPMK